MSTAAPGCGIAHSMGAWLRERTRIGLALALGSVLTLALASQAQLPAAAAEGWAEAAKIGAGEAATAPTAEASKPAQPAVVPGPVIALEPKALAILKGASERLAAAKTMSFTALVGYESPSRLGPALVYMSRYDVTMQRPDKLRVVSPGDGPPSEFYYDGKTMVAFAPAQKVIASASAPPTIDAMLEAAYKKASIYYPFTDLIVADPYKDLAEGLRVAFYIGQSKEVAGTTTDIVAYANDHVFIQVWIGAEDKLPRRLRAVFRKDPSQLRHEMELSNWRLDVPVTADEFSPPPAAKEARPITFNRPEAAQTAPVGAAPSTDKATPAK